MRFELHQDLGADTVVNAFIKDRSKMAFIRGPLGSGKTYGVCQRIFGTICEQVPDAQGVRKSRWYFIRNNYPDLLSTTCKEWLELYEDLGRYRKGGSLPPEHQLRFKLPDKTFVKADITFIALDRPKSIKKIRGSNITGCWINETKEIRKSILDLAHLRCGRYPSKTDGGPTWHGIVGDYNAPDEDHWLYTLAEEVQPTGWKFFKQPGGLMKEMSPDERGLLRWTGKFIPNPKAENLHNLTDGINYYIQGKEGKDDDWVLVELCNEYGVVSDGKLIYEKQWNDTIHVSSTIQVVLNAPIIIGLDFGLTPTAIIGQETPSGVLNILEEVIGDGMGIEQFIKQALRPVLNRSYKGCEWNFVGDPSGNRRADTDEDTVFKVLSRNGLDCEAANTNDIDIRLEAVRKFLQEMRDGVPAFQLHKRCKVLRKGFNSGYHFRRIQVVGDARYTDKPNKNKFSHPHDALQYLCMWVIGGNVISIEFSRGDDEEYI